MDRREIRVFVSSTFRDLIAEREYLIKRVFPEMRRYARERELEFTEIDLRWGLTEEDATLGRIVRTCLEEIDRCSPFFICIFGDRYGWSPQYTDIQKDPTLLHEYPWLEEAVLEEQSIFEMEVTYALLQRPKQPGQFVYARKNANANEKDAAKLEALKQRIREAGYTLQEFATPDELGALVRRDLLSAIEERWPEALSKPSNDPQAIERRMHEAFAAARRKAYIADIENINALNKNAETARVPLVVTAPSGMGKSALLAYWSKFYKARHPEALVITHFVGLTGTGGSAKDVLRHLFAEIAAYLGDPSLLAQSEDNLAKELSGLLARISKPVIIVIDALNQLDEGIDNLDWLPTFLPENVHLLLSTTEGPVLAQLKERGCEVLALRALRSNEREALLVRYLGEYRKQLSLEQTRRIAGDEKTASPLFLRTLIEELRLSGAHSTLDARIAKYLSCKTLDELFSHVLERMEHDYGEHVVYSILTAIWASQRGLSESEVLDLSVSRSGQRVTRAELSAFLIALDYQLIVRDGIITLFHDFLRDAVERRYLATDGAKREVHARLADYFMADRLTKRGSEELIWHLKEAKLDRHLRALLLDVDFILYFADDDRKWDYLRLWRELDDEGYADGLEELARDLSVENKLRLGQLLYDAGKFFHAERVLRSLYDQIEHGDASDAIRSTLLGSLGQAYQALSRLDEAEHYLRQHLQLTETSFGPDSAQLIDALDEVGALAYAKGSYEEAIQLFERAAKICTDVSLHSKLTSALTNLGAALYQMGKLDRAKEVFLQAEYILLQQRRDFTPQMSSILNNLGAIEQRRKNIDEATTYLQRSLNLFEKIYGPNHIETITCLMNLGAIDKTANNFSKAQLHYHEALTRLATGNGESELIKANILFNVAQMNVTLRNFKEAEGLFHEVLSLRCSKLATDSPAVLSVMNHLGITLEKQGRWQEAADLFSSSLPRQRVLLGPDSAEIRESEQSYQVALDHLA
jgi:nephrocystin-3